MADKLKGFNMARDSLYKVSESVDEIISSVSQSKAYDFMEEELSVISEAAPIVKMVNLIIIQAIKDRASDIHIEPSKDVLRVRYRIDGCLYEVFNLPLTMQNAIVSRIKILCDLDITESRKPQDGRFKFKFEDREIDLRVSSFPTIYGENIVMRLLDKSAFLKGLNEIGFLDDDLERFKKNNQIP